MSKSKSKIRLTYRQTGNMEYVHNVLRDTVKMLADTTSELKRAVKARGQKSDQVLDHIVIGEVVIRETDDGFAIRLPSFNPTANPLSDDDLWTQWFGNIYSLVETIRFWGANIDARLGELMPKDLND